jgi:2-hydroxychromene-2-carboxylate isomerase
MTTNVDFWFDPLCPWAWLTSRWILEVEAVRDVQVRWHVMSLALLNADREGLSDEYKQRMEAAIGTVRVCIAAEQGHGAEVLGPLYTALGERIHVKAEPNERPMVESALAAAGLPVELADTLVDASYDEALQISHDAGMAPVGQDVGTPIIHFDGFAIFGPVVTPAPKGEAAGTLWDAVATIATVPGFYELKRGRDVRPTFD